MTNHSLKLQALLESEYYGIYLGSFDLILLNVGRGSWFNLAMMCEVVKKMPAFMQLTITKGFKKIFQQRCISRLKECRIFRYKIHRKR